MTAEGSLRHRSYCAIVAEGYPTCTCTVTYWRQRVASGVVTTAEAEARLAATEAFLEEVAAPPASQSWDELVEVVDDLRGQFD